MGRASISSAVIRPRVESVSGTKGTKICASATSSSTWKRRSARAVTNVARARMGPRPPRRRPAPRTRRRSGRRCCRRRPRAPVCRPPCRCRTAGRRRTGTRAPGRRPLQASSPTAPGCVCMAVWFCGIRRSPQIVIARAYSATVWPQYTSAAVRDDAHAARFGGRDRLLRAVPLADVALFQSGKGVQVVRAELAPQQHQPLHRTGIPHQARRDRVLRLGPDQLAPAAFLPAALPVIGCVGPTALELPVHADHGAHAGPVRPRRNHPLTDPAIRPRTKSSAAARRRRPGASRWSRTLRRLARASPARGNPPARRAGW